MITKTSAQIAALSAAGFLFGAANALAFDVADFKFSQDYTGPVVIKYSLATTECVTTTGNPNGCFGGNVTNTDPGIPGPGGGTFNETTYGVGNVETIKTEGGSLLWSRGGAGYDIAMFMYGLADLSIQAATGGFDVYNVGCQGGGCDGNIHLDFYGMDSFPDFTDADINAGNRYTLGGFAQFAGITNVGKLLWETTAAPGISQVLPAASLVQNVVLATLPTSGSGSFLGDCTGGPACVGINNVNLNTNGQQGGTDFFGEFTLAVAADSWQGNGWLGDNQDPVRGGNIPVPGALVLVIPGLMGIAWSRRRTGKGV